MTTSAAPAAAADDRTWLDRAYAALPLTTIFIWLAALYAYQSWRHSSPWLFTDELELTQLSRSIAETGEAARRGEPHFFETLYTYLTAPAWWIDSTASAYELVRYIGVFTMTAVVFPTYFLARTIVGKPAALFAATATAAVPALAYSQVISEEALAYPYAALCFFLIAKAIVAQTRWWIAGAVVAHPRRPARSRRARRDRRRVRARRVLLLPDERRRRALARIVDGLGLGRRVRADDGRDHLLLGRRGQLLPELADRDRPLPRADDRVRRLGRRRLRHRPRRPAGRRRARRAPPTQGRGADTGAARLYRAPARGAPVLRRLHRRQSLVPLDGLRHGHRRTESHLSRSARLRGHGPLARAASAALGPPGRGHRVRRLPARVGQLRPRERPVLRRARPRDRADVEPQPLVHRQRRAVGAHRDARCVGAVARAAEIARSAPDCGAGRRRRDGRARSRLDAHGPDLRREVLERLGRPHHPQLPEAAHVARRHHGRRAGRLSGAERQHRRGPRDLADRVLESLA